MKIAVAQINTTIGDFDGNASKICKFISQAKDNGVDLVVFPEMAITGYPPRDLLEKPYFILKNLDHVERIARQCNGVSAIVGCVSINELTTGKGLFNSAALLNNGKIDFIQHKALLPTYDVFDEARHFEPGTIHKVRNLGGLKIGITICEDVWSTVTFGGRKLYRYDPVETLAKAGAEIIINISASPFVLGKGRVRESLLTQTAKRHGLPIVYVNMVGGNDELVFDGRSVVVNKNGEMVRIGKTFEEDFFEIDTGNLKKWSGIISQDDTKELHDALVLGLLDYAHKCDFKNAVIGLSGGIDSAVVAALAVEALGAKNVRGIAMPSPYSSVESVEDAKTLAKNLGISFEIVPITDVYNSYLKLPVFSDPVILSLSKDDFILDTSVENIQARIRGNILMAVSNKTGALVLSTGNKSELAVGYCTLYGDMAGGLAVISDVPKTMVYDLARHINKREELIPRNCLTKPPSAELRPDQKDTDLLPPYDILDQVLKLYIEEHLSPQAIAGKDFDKKVVDDVVKRVDRNEYKRRQAPPGLKVTSKAFGWGRCHPIAWKY